jgi:iron complex transport system ATP-binding protein
VAYLPQVLPQPSSLRVYEALYGAQRATCPGLNAEEREQRLQAVLERRQLHALALQRMDRLSGGQCQMVGLAQVLVRQTPLPLLDEPTSALDLRWQVLALETVRQAARERGAVVCVALHDLNLAARLCDRLVLLGREGVLAEGAPGEVLQPALLRQAYAVEARVEFTARQDCVVVERAASTPA